MIFRTEELVEKLSIFSKTTDVQYTKFDKNANTLEIVAKGSTLQFIVGNPEYVQKLSLDNIDSKSDFDVSIDSSIFFNLLSKTTTETIELSVKDKNLYFVGNGTFIIPVIYVDTEMYHVTDIPLENVTISTSISYEILESIITYNAKQFERDMGVDAIQKLYYFDNKGAITFNSGAVVCQFDLADNIKLLLKPVVSNLFRNFKLSKSDSIEMKLGHRLIGNVTYPVLFMKDNLYSLTVVCPMESLINNYPVEKIRERVTKDLGHEVVLNVSNLADCLDRFKIFTSGIIFMEMTSIGVKIYSGSNEETVLYENQIHLDDTYKLSVNLDYFYSVLKTLPYKFMKLRFGDHQSLTTITQNIYHVIPECEEV